MVINIFSLQYIIDSLHFLLDENNYVKHVVLSVVYVCSLHTDLSKLVSLNFSHVVDDVLSMSGITPPLVSVAGEKNLKKPPLLPKEFDEQCEAGSFEMQILHAARDLGFFVTPFFHSRVNNLEQMMKCSRSVSRIQTSA
jgi:hypothetical protein